MSEQGTTVTLVNFGGNIRVLYDIKQMPVAVGIGEIVEITLASGTIDFLEHAMPNDTLLVIPQGTKLEGEIVTCFDILRDMQTEPYDELLTRVRAVLGEEQVNQVEIRPTRGQMMEMLREVAFKYAQDNFRVPTKGNRVRVNEEVKEEDIKELLPDDDKKTEPKKEGKTPKKKARVSIE